MVCPFYQSFKHSDGDIVPMIWLFVTIKTIVSAIIDGDNSGFLWNYVTIWNY